MPHPHSQSAPARRAEPEDHRSPHAAPRRTGLLNAGLATLAISILGLGVATASLTPSSAQGTHADLDASAAVTTVASGVAQPSSFQRDVTTISRSNFREALSDTDESDELDSGALSEAAENVSKPAQTSQRAVRARAALLDQQSDAAAERSKKIEEKRKAAKKKAAAAKKKADEAKKKLGTPTLPVKKYSIVARFGDVGAWARYHTGIDFSAPIGAKIYAPTAGVVEHAGSGGEAAGWAGNYVVVKQADGSRTLFAHMSSISVRDGQKVIGGDLLGHVGQTGRAFGPHLHFEVYPAGTTPGDIYKAVDPKPWLNKLGVKP